MRKAGWLQVSLPAILMLLIVAAAADGDRDDGDEAAAEETENRRAEREPGPGRQVGDALREAGLDLSGPEARTARRILLEETKLRRRLAQIGRLRELAVGNADRLAALDSLEVKARSQHDRKVDRAMERVDRGTREKLEQRLERGRGRVGHGRKDSVDAAEEDARSGRSGRPEGRGKPQNTDRPKGNGDDTGARGAKRGNQ